MMEDFRTPACTEPPATGRSSLFDPALLFLDLRTLKPITSSSQTNLRYTWVNSHSVCGLMRKPAEPAHDGAKLLWETGFSKLQYMAFIWSFLYVMYAISSKAKVSPFSAEYPHCVMVSDKFGLNLAKSVAHKRGFRSCIRSRILQYVPLRTVQY